MSISPSVVYAGIDWLTLTTGTGPSADEAYQRARALAVEVVAQGNKLTAWGTHGYKGFAVPHLRCGHRDGDVLIELSGALAERRWRDFLPYAHNVSRIDPQVTVTFPRRVRNLAQQAYDAPPVRLHPNLPAITKRMFVERDGGTTCYLGAPTSDRRARLYDKHAESAGEYPPFTWRYELQVRRAMGGDLARLIDGTHDVPGAIASVVRSFFCSHGVSPWFNADGPTVFAPSRVARTDLSRWLQWISRSVRPGVRRWSDRATRTAIIAALGLDELEQLEVPRLAAPALAE